MAFASALVFPSDELSTLSPGEGFVSSLDLGWRSPALSSNQVFTKQVEEVANLLRSLFHHQYPELDSFSSLSHELLDHHEKIGTFVREVEDPVQWLADVLSLSSSQAETEFSANPVALVFRMEGFAYGEFVRKWLLRPGEIPQEMSFGVTLNLNELPDSLRGRVILVNRGDGLFGERPKSQIDQTEKHELLHAVYNSFFSQHEFMPSAVLKKLLEAQLTCPSGAAFEYIAERLGEGMFENARSEIISYMGSGTMTVNPCELGASFWNDHAQVVNQMLLDERLSDSDRGKIVEAFERAYQSWCADVVRFYEIAGNLPCEYGKSELSAASLAQLLLTKREDLYR